MNNKMPYRAEIDGLRAIAVLAVMIYHANFAFGSGILLKGGFFGVDVFFVISGYLITSLILREYKSTGRFSIRDFYERRARRLIPPLLLVMLVSIPYSYKYLYPSQLLDYAKSIIASLAFVANIYWDVSLQEYGAESGNVKPFLHTWSLSVEEQFYIFFPIILIAVYRRFQAKTIFWMCVAFVISLLFSQWMTQQDLSFSFYQLPTRLWELLSGAMLGFIVVDQGGRRSNKVGKLMPSVGLALIAYSLFCIEFESNHPGLITLIPVIGTLLIIAFAEKDELITRILSCKPFVWVGLISYSLYLWHYPIYAFARIRGGSFDETTDKLELILLTFVLSILSYLFIEKLFRNKRKVSLKLFTISMMFAILTVNGASAFIIYNDVSKERFADLVEKYGENEFDNTVLRESSTTFVDNPIPESRFKEGSAKVKVFIVGNSHAKGLYNAFVQNLDLFSEYEFELFGINIGTNATNFSAQITNNPQFHMSDVVVLSNRYMPATSKYHGDIVELPNFIDKIQALGKKIIIATNTVEFIPIEEKEIFDWYAQNSEKFDKEELKSLFYSKKNDYVEVYTNGSVRDIALQKGVTVLEKSDYICDHELQQCDGVTPDGFKSFYDYGHYTLRGAKHFGKKIAEIGWLRLE